MQLTIDSNDALEIVLQVVGSVYGVQLVAERGTAQRNSPVTPTPRQQRSSSKPVSRGGGRRDARATTPTTDPGAIRRWAQDNNLIVSSRGRIPSSVVEAFRAAHHDRGRSRHPAVMSGWPGYADHDPYWHLAAHLVIAEVDRRDQRSQRRDMEEPSKSTR